MIDLDAVDFAKGAGLITVVSQDATSGIVLTVAHADREALERTIASGEMHYRSRTRGAWHKGAVSGHIQRVVSLTLDCDADALLARVIPAGPACHTGAQSCFADATAIPDVLDVFDVLDMTIAARAAALGGATGNPSAGTTSYTQALLSDRNLRLKKIGEEASELVLACADGDAPRATEEVADLVYHALVALHALGGSLAGVRTALAARAGANPAPR